MYLDPGFGSMILQIIVAGIAGVGAALFFLKDKIKSIFNKNKEEIEQATENDQEPN